MQQLAADGWSDAPLGHQQLPAREANDEASTTEHRLANAYNDVTSLFGLVQLLEEAPPAGNASAAALALAAFMDMGSNVQRGDANAFLLVGGDKWVPHLCFLLVQSGDLSFGICAMALESLAGLASTVINDQPLIRYDDLDVQVCASSFAGATGVFCGLVDCATKHFCRGAVALYGSKVQHVVLGHQSNCLSAGLSSSFHGLSEFATPSHTSFCDQFNYAALGRNFAAARPSHTSRKGSCRAGDACRPCGACQIRQRNVLPAGRDSDHRSSPSQYRYQHTGACSS